MSLVPLIQITTLSDFMSASRAVLFSMPILRDIERPPERSNDPNFRGLSICWNSRPLRVPEKGH
jgi:hypothetical protein